MRFILFNILFILPCIATIGQVKPVTNLNIDNGLSSNHVYCTLVDSNGYLWISTPDGVFRYNGYNTVKYDYSDGLSSIDIWNMTLDKKGRIWLHSIAPALGYIENNKYKEIIQAHKGEDQIYPSFIKHTDSLTYFTNRHLREGYEQDIIVYKDDSYCRKSMRVSLADTFRSLPLFNNNYIYNVARDYIYKYDGRFLLTDMRDTTFDVSSLKLIEKKYSEKIIFPFVQRWTFFEENVMALENEKNIIPYFSINDLKQNNYILGSNEKLTHGFPHDKKFIVLTNSHTHILDSNLQLLRKYAFNDILPYTSLSNVIYFTDDKLWGIITSTTDEGLYIIYKKPEALHPIYTLTDSYEYVNSQSDTTGYWWSKQDNLLTVQHKDVALKTNNIGDIEIYCIVSVNDSTSIISSRFNLHWLDKGLNLKDIYSDEYTINEYKYYMPKKPMKDVNSLLFNATYKIVKAKNDSLFTVSTGVLSSSKIHIDTSKKHISINSISSKRFSDAIYNRSRDYAILYTKNDLTFINDKNGGKVNLTYNELHPLDIFSIENILHDDDGNIYIKTYDKLYYCNPTKAILKPLFRNYNLKNAKVNLINNELYIAGDFGVLVGETDGAKVRKIKTFSNTKKIYYDRVLDAQLSKGYSILKTDKGFYMVDHSALDAEKEQYSIILETDDKISTINNDDSIALDKNNQTINLDLIKPTGTGSFTLQYYIHNTGFTSTTTDIPLTYFSPGTYYRVSVIAKDATWQSDQINFTIYVTPDWWQTTTAKRIFLIAGLLLLIALLYLTFVLTRRAVNKNNEKKNNQRDLELKSIYSQINPHFIFNSLSTAQYFVKKNRNKEAYDHINQFSDLLRSYIKSSRNKYITITEEIENLINYLELQLKRFESKFIYNFHVDNDIDSDSVKIPSLLLQPIVENALNHGIFHKKGVGHINISFRLISKDTLRCIVEDDGIGREQAKKLQTDRTRKADSYGTILIKELIDTFNKYEKININIEYQDKKSPHTGTIVIVNIQNFENV